MFWAFEAAEAYPLYRFSRKRVYLVVAAGGTLSSVLFLLRYMSEVLRWGG